MRHCLLMMLAVVLAAAQTPQTRPTQDKEVAELKQRMEERYAALLKLMDAGKVGETWDGQVDAVKPAYKDEKVDPQQKDSDTIKGLLEKENKDRLRLYELLAKGKPVSPAEVGIESGKRKFKKAAPEHFLKPKDKDWIRKKELKPEPR
jgi:uncharacterized protein YdbL (DUF1318 family)